MVAQIGPLAEHFELLDLGLSFYADILHALRHRRKLGFAEGFLAGNHEDNIVGHEAQHRLEITRFARLHLCVDQGSDRAFFLGHETLPLRFIFPHQGCPCQNGRVLRIPAMHDIKLIRDDPVAFDEGLKRRTLAPLSGEILKHDSELRALLTRLQQAQARRNEASKLIGQAKAKKDEAQAQALMSEVAGLKTEIQQGEEDERRLQAALNDFLATIPNLPAPDVPVGADEKANVEIRSFGEKPGMNFKPKEHFELGEALGQMDFEAAAKMSGARFVVLKKQLARLERAIAQFMLDLHTEQFGYTEASPPVMVRDQAMFGTGQLPKFAEDLFRTTTDYWLIPTAEVPLTNLVREQILDE